MSALDTQVGGSHYREGGIQPVQYIEANSLKFLEGCVVKRVTRHDRPTGKGRQDIEKAIHELQLLLELRYPLADVQVRNGAPGFEVDPLGFRKWCGHDGCLASLHGDAPFCEQHTTKTADPVPTRPAWPDDKVFRWMAQDADGNWYAYVEKPAACMTLWQCFGSSCYIYVWTDQPNLNWRDTLIERGVDE